MHFIRRADEESGYSDTVSQPLIYSVCCNKMPSHEHTFVKMEIERKKWERKKEHTKHHFLCIALGKAIWIKCRQLPAITMFVLKLTTARRLHLQQTFTTMQINRSRYFAIQRVLLCHIEFHEISLKIWRKVLQVYYRYENTIHKKMVEMLAPDQTKYLTQTMENTGGLNQTKEDNEMNYNNRNLQNKRNVR